ncbi:hypothetical protein RRF57_000722 [Xylaria bambusicola]|uniref:Uncharacterized protein n=1 Tax=Xylaria bambusicola TaxID=326684 RepID=A0AAN7YZZ0_9PEZI
MEVQQAPSEFHFYPRLPRELQDTIWKFYSASLPDVRHDFHRHDREYGSINYHYRRYCHKILKNIETKFLLKEEGFSSVHGALAVPKAMLLRYPCRIGYPESEDEEPAYVAVNYENDVFSFANACCGHPRGETCGEQIANWFDLPTQLTKDHIKAPEGAVQQGIFSARRLAFQLPGSRSMNLSIPTFTDFDLQVLRRFKRLKEIFFVVLEVCEVPISVRNRASPRPEDHPVYGGYMVISQLDDTENAQLLAALDHKVKVTYALDLGWWMTETSLPFDFGILFQERPI